MAELQYALREGQLVYIDEVKNGLQCGCLCPACGAVLIAANGGSQTEHHFRHYHGADCGLARETALHLLGKEILLQDRCLFLPGFPEGGRLTSFDRALAEQQISPAVRADVLLEGPGSQLNVEIRVTHAVDAIKRQHLMELELPTVEIDLSGFLGMAYREENLREVIRSGRHTRWVYHPQSRGYYLMAELCDYLPLSEDGSCYCPLREKRMMLQPGRNSCRNCRYMRPQYLGAAGEGCLPCAWRFCTLRYDCVEEIIEMEREEGRVLSAVIRADGKRLRLQGEANDILTVKLPKKLRTAQEAGPYFTVYELWQPGFASMVVRNCETGKALLLLGKDGKLPLRDNKPVGYYAADLHPGYDCSKKRYTLWAADKAVWILEHCVTNHKAGQGPGPDKRSIYDRSCHTLEELWKRSGRRTFHVRHMGNGQAYCLEVEGGRITAIRRADPETGLLSEDDFREEVRPFYRTPIWQWL
ncbi:MAG: hypothetical protein MJ075_02590 [Oscillospiraceae bacterium]|nr:hypothetical protein [Oscillospiraceae bacterium]